LKSVKLTRIVEMKSFLKSIKWISTLFAGGKPLRIPHRDPSASERYNEIQAIPVLIFGAGELGAAYLENLRRHLPQYRACGFVDDDPDKTGTSVAGCPVLGLGDSLPRWIQELDIRQVFIAVNNINGSSLNRVIGLCRKARVPCRRVASVTDLVTHEIYASRAREIEIIDLLNRDPVYLDMTSIRSMLKGKRILVTGAGGSIGSELCRQILDFEPASMIMVEKGENPLHDLTTLIRPRKKPGTETHFIFGCVTNREKMESAFYQFQPQIVFHAAAHKHVPLMEDNADEAVINNIHGTRVTADLSHQLGVETFVMVSTDKVVRPTSVMGMTKKLAENYIQWIGGRSTTRFLTVRFGNVLGTNSSVVPLFQKQIENGGPVTVTHPQMKRYFMLIHEAAQLILQAATMGAGREIFMLEMGNPVKILDLARKMILLAGFEPGRDIQIVFPGTRPGEKLNEELVGPGENLLPTEHNKIHVLNSQANFPDQWVRSLENLCQKALRYES
jgi:FlaA1/EpsC-like NDP-sugar epimerase